MQLITTKTLPPLPASLASYLAKTHGSRVKLEVKYCPTMDLIATYPVLELPNHEEAKRVTNDAEGHGESYDETDDDLTSVDVWRLNGQKVFEISMEGEDGKRIEVVDFHWRDDGLILAILSSDNTTRLVNSYSGKTVHSFSSLSSYAAIQSPRTSMSTSQQSKQPLTSIESMTQTPRPNILSYSTHFADSISTRSQLHCAQEHNGTVLDDLLSLNADIGKLLQSQADLPKELASIDVEAFLPKLACLPPAGFGIDDVFSTRASIDAIFHSSKRNLKSGAVDILAAGTNKGTVHLRFFDSFEVGDVDLSAAIGLPKGAVCGPVRYIANHPFSSGSLIISEIVHTRKPNRLHLFRLNLTTIVQSSTTLPVLATKATQLHNLFRYLSQIQSQLVREIKTAFDLPSRFLSNLNEDLVRQDGEGSTFANAAYNTIVTGETSQAFKEWLAEQLGERGVKRWEKAVGDCLDLVRRLVSESWNPAVERMGVVVSRLAGLIGWNAQGDTEGHVLGIDKKIIESLRATIDVMAICGEELLRDVNQEIAGFTSFVKWLKWEVEAAGLEDTSERLDEMRESSDHADISTILDYIESGPANTIVKKYIGPALSEANKEDEDDISFYANFKNNRRKSGENQHLPTFDILLTRTKRQCEKLFEQVAHTLRKSIMVEHLTQLPSNMQAQFMDVRLLLEPEYGTPKIHIISWSETENEEFLYTIIDSVSGDHKQQRDTSANSKLLRIRNIQNILDVKFVDDTSFIVLASTSNEVQLYTHASLQRSQEDNEFELCHTFEHGLMESGMRPRWLEVNGRKGRRALAVVDEEGKGYCVFDLDSMDEPEEDVMQE